MKKEVSTNDLNPDGLRIVLVLQGGGALGAYQGGVCQALYEQGLAPQWIAGTSIGALNGAIVAGNEPQVRIARLQEFWSCLSQPGLSMLGLHNETLLNHFGMLAAMRTVGTGVPNLFVPRFDPRFALGWPAQPQDAGLYDTAAMEATLKRLIDFEVLNSAGSPRFSANAITVTDGELVTFDSRREPIKMRHLLASTAMPPAFAPVQIDGEWYWDGGLYSSTPLQTVFDDTSTQDTLVFLVDLWSEHGALPTSFDAAETRRKDTVFGARTQRELESHVRLQRLRKLLRDCQGHVPPALRSQVESASRGGDRVMHVVRLCHATGRTHSSAKDLDFTGATLEWRWNRGYGDTRRALENAPWLKHPRAGTSLVVHEVPNYANATDAEREKAWTPEVFEEAGLALEE